MALSVSSWLVLAVILCLHNFGFSQELGRSNEIIFHYNNTYKYNEIYKVSVSKHTEYIMEFAGNLETYDTPARVTVASDHANRTYPLFITARQQKGVFSWQLPMLVQTPTGLDQFTNISRTLCPHNNLFDEQTDTCDISSQNTPIIHLTSSSPNEIEVTILVETVDDFYIKLNRTTNFTITTSQPKYYFFPFKQPGGLDAAVAKRKQVCNHELGDRERRLMSVYKEERDDAWFWKPKSVILMIESDDDICAVVSIQNFSCPVFDNERDILYDGYYLTMTRRGGITLTQNTFPVGFYIVFIVKNSDEDCSGNATTTTLPRVKNFSFQIVSTISYVEYLVAAGAALSLFLCFYLAFFITILVQRRWRPAEGILTEEVQSIITPTLPHDETNVTIVRRRNINTIESTQSTSRGDGDGHSETSTTDSDTESDFSTLDDINTEKDVYRLPARLCVAALARSRARVLAARSRMYTRHLLTVVVFYTLPVVQLVVTYQRLLNQSGDQDLCYFNFFCAHPLLVLSDFNHVFSNLGYVLLGALFVLQVWRRERWHEARPAEEKELGIPQHFGLFYAMGIALISEGILSAAYHVCPNSMNFQFDTSFMYVTGVLCMVKIYQSRHPDINARAHATFPVLALIIFIGLVGVLNANMYFWVAFTILHLTTCLFMTFQIYYMGRFRLAGGMALRAARQLATRPLAAITPTYCARCVLLVLANLANWALAAYGVAQHSRDFASHLLLVLMSNLFLYTLFYIAMKLLHRESITWYSWVFIVLTYGTWFSSSYFYLDQSTNWALTPAESRRSNRVCSLLQLYDSHDIWHFMSSMAMFFSFSMYLTIDDNIAHVPRNNIMVF